MVPSILQKERLFIKGCNVGTAEGTQPWNTRAFALDLHDM
jgi:hypothetical protein